MIGLGTIVNVAAIIAGGILGLTCRHFLSERCQETMIRAMGFAIIVMSLGSTLSQMLTVDISQTEESFVGVFGTRGTMMSASLGKGCAFSAVPVALWQGSVTLLGYFIAPVLTAAALSNISYVGNVLILCVGVNLIWPKTIRVANLLPAILIAACFP